MSKFDKFVTFAIAFLVSMFSTMIIQYLALELSFRAMEVYNIDLRYPFSLMIGVWYGYVIIMGYRFGVASAIRHRLGYWRTYFV